MNHERNISKLIFIKINICCLKNRKKMESMEHSCRIHVIRPGLQMQ